MKKDTVVCGLLVALGGIVLSAVVVAGFMLLFALSQEAEHRRRHGQRSVDQNGPQVSRGIRAVAAQQGLFHFHRVDKGEAVGEFFKPSAY